MSHASAGKLKQITRVLREAITVATEEGRVNVLRTRDANLLKHVMTIVNFPRDTHAFVAALNALGVDDGVL